MTVNSMDAEQIVREVVDAFRVKVSHLRVDLNGQDLQDARNFLTGVLSKYVDDKHIHNNQYNPATNSTEEVVPTGKPSDVVVE